LTPLIDLIEQAFIDEREQSELAGGAVRCTLVVEAIELCAKVDDSRQGLIEGAVSAAYMEAASVWGQEWVWQSGDVAERVCDHLRALVSDAL
jgi:hypothetical protein